MNKFIMVLTLLVFSATLAHASTKKQLQFNTIADSAFTQLITLPDPNGHTQIIKLINSATSSIFLEIYHLSNLDVQSALIDAFNNNISVQVIVDRNFSESADGIALMQRFHGNMRNNVAAPVPIIASSAQFSISHTKSMVIDAERVVIGTENLSNSYAGTREQSLVIDDPSVASDLSALFKQDWINAQANTALTPTLAHDQLVVSPTNSDSKIVDLIQSAKTSIDLEVENLGAPEVIQALSDAHTQKNVAVRVLVPYCDKNANPYYNVPAIQQLKGIGVVTRLMPPPESADTPYIHAKVILVDLNTKSPKGFVGSENFSTNSLTKARELGILFSYLPFLQDMESDFATDFAKAIDIQNPNPICPPVTD